MEMWGVSGVYRSLNNEKNGQKKKNTPNKAIKTKLGVEALEMVNYQFTFRWELYQRTGQGF